MEPLMNLRPPIVRSLVAVLVAATVGACSGTEKPEALMAKARASIAASDPKAAEIHLKNLLQQDENNAEARFLLAGLYLAHDDLRSAEKEYRRARDLGFDRDRLTPPLLETLYRGGQYKEVLAEAKGLALGQPAAQAQALTTVGRAQLRLGQGTDAGKSFAAALAASPGFVPAEVGAASVQAIADRASARAAVQAILQREPTSIDALLLMADIELADRRPEAARALYEKVAELSPRDVETRGKLVALTVDQNDLALARKWLDELRKLAPSAPGTHYLVAVVDTRENKLEPARQSVQEALRLAPDYLPAVSLAAGLNLSLNALEQAERHSRTLIERAPDNPVGYRLLGATYLRMNAPDRALEAVRPALGRTPADPLLLSIAGEASLKMNEPQAAAGYFARASKLEPENPRTLTGLALSHLASGQGARGIGELEQAVELDSANIQADVALVMARMRERQYDKALEAVARMEQKAPKSPTPPNLRGAVLSARGDIAGARAAFEKALQIDPAFFPAAANLAAFDLRDNRPGDARQRYQSVLAKDPKNSQAAVAIAMLTVRTGGPREQVLDELKKAREANPDAVLPILASARYLIDTQAPKDAIPMLQEAANRNPENTQVLALLATAFVRSDQSAQAIATWEKQLRIAPDAIEPQVGIATTLQRQGKKDEAMRIAAKMRANDRQKLAGTVLEGDLLGADGNWADAAERYRIAFAEQRALPIGFKLHRALRASSREDDAERFLRDWIRSDPANLRLRLYAGDAETTRERWKQAFEQYAVVIDKEPKNAIALNNAAWALHQLKDPRALDHARRAWEAAPKSAAILDTYGVILHAGGDRKGLEMLQKAVELAPHHAQIRLHLAEALAGTGDKAGAKAQIDELLKNTPEGSAADAARALQARL